MTGNDQTIQASANLSSGGRLGFSCRPVSLSELSALVSRWGEEQDLPLGSLFHSTWQATQLALEFSILTSSPALPLPAGNGSAERRRERNGNASTAGRAARPPPATVENTALLEDGQGPDPEAPTTDIRQKCGRAEMRWGDKGSSCDAAGFISNKVTRYLIPFPWSVSSVWSVQGPQTPVPTNRGRLGKVLGGFREQAPV